MIRNLLKKIHTTCILLFFIRKFIGESDLEFRVNYVVVGLFVLIVTVFALITGLWLSAGFQKQNYDTYEILMYEPVSGLNEQAPVKFNGVQVGYVQSIHLNSKNPRQVILLTHIVEGTPISQSTVATLMSQGITGVTYIGLKAKTPHAPLLKQLPGQLYPIIPSTPSLLVEVDAAIRGLSNNIDTISASIEQILSQQNIRLFNQTLTHIDHILANIDNHAEDIGQILKNTRIFSEHLPMMVKNFNASTQTLTTASNEATQFFATGTYAIQQWSNQVIPSTFSLVSQVGRVLANLEQMTNELQQQPSLLIRGKVAPPLGPGEQ